MPTDLTRADVQTLDSRVAVVEREVEGEKMVTRHILEQTRRNSDDLAAIKTRLDRIERKVDGLEEKFDGLEGKVGGLDRKVDVLSKSLPAIIGEVMRGILRERDGRA